MAYSVPPPPRTQRRLRLVREQDEARAKARRIAKGVLAWTHANAPVLFADRSMYPERPKTRGECADVPRPCPFVSCRFNLGLETHRLTSQLRLNFGERMRDGELTDDAENSCALDVAERRAHSQEEVADLLGGVTVEWIRRTERSAEATLKEHHTGEMSDLLELYDEDSARDDSRWSIHDGTLADVGTDVNNPPHRDVLVIEAEERAATEAWSTHVVALARAGIPLRAAWTLGNLTEDEIMVKPQKNKSKKLSISGVPAGALERKRFSERLPVKNDEAQDAVLAGQLADTIKERLALLEERREAMSKFRERRTYLDEQEKELAEAVHSHTRLEDVQVIEYLLPSNEVMSVRSDTGEVVRSRTADSEDLQDDLFPLHEVEDDGADEARVG